MTMGTGTEMEMEMEMEIAMSLSELTKQFVQNPTTESLEKARKQWFVVAKDWSRCYAFNIGEVKGGNFFLYFGKFPVNSTSLEDRIQKMSLQVLKRYKNLRKVKNAEKFCNLLLMNLQMM